jgi:hypothetical protein
MSDNIPPVLSSPSPPPGESGSPVRQMAMCSLAAPFLGLGVNLLVSMGLPGNRLALFVGGLTSVGFIFAGLVLGIVALVKNRRAQLPGVTPRAVGGVCISGLLILLMLAGLPGLLRAIEKAKAQPRQPANEVKSLER